MKILYLAILLILSISAFAQKREIQNYSIDSAKKEITENWEDCTTEWKGKLIQLDYEHKVIKLYHSPNEIADYKIIDNMTTFEDPKNNNQVYVYSCINPFGQTCKLYLTFPPKGVVRNFVTLLILQEVPYMYYLKAT